MRLPHDTSAPDPFTTVEKHFISPTVSTENDQNKQKRQEKHSSDSIPNKNENSDQQFSEISITSIILFLEHHLEKTLHTPQPLEEKRIWFPLKPVNQNKKNLEAIYAYQHAAEISKEKLNRLKQKEPIQYNIEELYALLRQLRRLSQNNVTSLQLKENTPFIKSIYDAIQIF